MSASGPASDDDLIRLLVEGVRAYAIFRLDASGHVASWSPGARHLKGYDAGEIVGRHFSVFYRDDDVRSGTCNRELAEAERLGQVEDEGWRVRKDGSLFWANDVIAPLHDSAGALVGFAKVTRDNTGRRRAEQERMRLVQSLVASKVAHEFLATVGHELRTPLTAILGWARMLSLPQLQDERRARAVETIDRNARASRVTSGTMRLEVGRVDLGAVLESALEAIRPAAEANGIRITREEERVSLVQGDAARLQQVMWNLLTNAVKFTPRGGRIILRLFEMCSEVHIVVRDTGVGVEPTSLAHVFEPFRRAQANDNRVHGGLGLGLTIAKHLVEQHGGQMQVQSEGRGQGATFTVRLPIPTPQQ